jgi:hypothetical protein
MIIQTEDGKWQIVRHDGTVLGAYATNREAVTEAGNYLRWFREVL